VLRRPLLLILVAVALVASCGGGGDDDADAGSAAGPAIGDHWHMAVGFSRCGEVLPDQQDVDGDPDGIHTHGDGLIHIHPFNEDAAHEHAVLGRFLDVVGAEVVDGVLTLADGGALDPADGCDGRPAELVVARWDDASDTSPEVDEVEAPDDLTGVRLDADGAVLAVAVVPRGTVPDLPASARTLPADVPPEAKGQGTKVDAEEVFVLAPVLGVHGEPCGSTATKARGRAQCYELGAPVLTSAAASSAQAITDGKAWGVQVGLTPQAQAALDAATAACVGASADCPIGQVAFVDGGQVIAAPRLATAGLTKLVITTATMDRAEAERLAGDLAPAGS
jgi:hypothetical protein